MSKSTPSFTLAEATKKLEGYCAYQDRCHQEVLHKLREMRIIPEAVDHIMGHLIKENFLNEERFAKSFVRGKFNIKNWGKERITKELKQREISRYNIAIALQEIDDAKYLQTLDVLAHKRLTALQEPNPLKRSRKLADYLLYRGWESHLVYDKIRELIP